VQGSGWAFAHCQPCLYNLVAASLDSKVLLRKKRNWKMRNWKMRMKTKMKAKRMKTIYPLFPTVTGVGDAPDPPRRRSPWHVDPSPTPRSIRHPPRTPPRPPQARDFRRQELSSRPRRLQRCQNHGKRRRFDCANAIGDIDGFGGSVAQLPPPSPARIDSCALTTPHTLRGVIVALNQPSSMLQK